ncbi:protein neprosin-like [Humulus lupulus]|uniref:protein neprosin-like n=1 Tax=Humulus lupulus TaxID=3486 RepID=UPI002B405E03|nr:protein neprosin-like [Humulus lupulus]
MESNTSSTLTPIFSFLLVVILHCANAASRSINYSQTLLDQLDLKLKLLNKPPLKTIKSSDGDIIDCIDIYKQPAFDHPALKNHTIQMKPSDFEAQTTENDTSKAVVFSQTWQRNGGFCPEGTIPVALLVTLGYNYIGAQGSINVWNPRVLADEYSTGQIWLKAGLADTFESIESGWVVNPKLYGDTLTRLFAYWTTDGYTSKGCFDLTCSGFVQTNPNVVLGGTLEPWSTQSGPQYELPVTITLDPKAGNWWLKLGQNVPVGYWPGSLFGYLQHSAVMVQWGGEVFSPNVRQKPHTTTAMGSGEFARLLHGSASYVKGVRIMDYSLSLKYPSWVGTWADEDYCYSAYNEVKYGVEPTFYFGGPGRNTLCP